MERPGSFGAGAAHSLQPSILRVWSAMRLIVLIGIDLTVSVEYFTLQIDVIQVLSRILPPIVSI